LVALLLALPGTAGARPPVDFERHVASLLGKLGCSTGACHGSFQGKGGFRLSLFGHDPTSDFLAITRGGAGRRIDVADPDRSLLLLKPTGQVPHGGGKRLDRMSSAYQVIRNWIAAGCRHASGSGRVLRLRVLPEEHLLRGPGASVRLAVWADFDDGTRADVTPFCDFRARDDTVAEVSPLGEVRGLRAGDTAVVVSYRSTLATAHLLVPAPALGAAYPAIPEESFLDHEVFTKLRRLGIVPSEPADDADFLRRVTIDTIGCLPSPAEVRAFLADRRPDKRRHKIDKLLAHPLHAALWATRLCDITACNVDVMDGPPELRGKRARLWHAWFRRRIADNVPYDQIVHGVLCATSRGGRDLQSWIGEEVAQEESLRRGFDTAGYARQPDLDLFWRRTSGEDFFPLEQMAELTAAAFLGVRLECAQCHKHPFDRWTQADYRGYANVFSQVRFGASPDTNAAVSDLLAERRRRPADRAGPPIPRLREVYLDRGRPRALPHPETDAPLPARPLDGPVLDGEADLREQLFRWMTRPDNPFFARSFVNRVWAHYFGVGLVEPVDDFSVSNPPSNERLLDALARDFRAGGYDIRRLERLILSSRTYQLSSRPNASNRGDRRNYSHALVRPLLAEVAVDVLGSALGTREDLGPDAPPGSRAIEVATNRPRASHLARTFRVFARPPRASTCDCERAREPALPQALFLMSDADLLRRMEQGRLRDLLASDRCDGDIIEDLFLATLSRFPDAAEKQAALEHLSGRSRKAALADVLWGLLNTREFILNH
jgi:hypothetical protein